MNTKNKLDQKNQRPTTRQRQEPKKQGQNHMQHDERKRHEQELPETRMTR